MADGQEKSGAGTVGEARKASQIQWDDSKMETNFANVVNIQGTREQVDVFFGTNRTWSAETGGPMEVDLTNRMILTPLAAKRMCTILTNVLREYEQRHGALKVDG